MKDTFENMKIGEDILQVLKRVAILNEIELDDDL